MYRFSFVGVRGEWEDGWFEREFDHAIGQLDMRSSVGMTTLRRYGTTVGQFLNVGPDGSLDAVRVSLLRECVWYRMFTPESPDPIRMFIKREPHKQAKLDTNRFRLISAVSLVDTMCDRIMLGWLADKVLNNVGKTPVMVGWSPLGPGLDWLINKFRHVETRGLDMTAWDWTVPGWLLLDIKQLIKDLAVGAPLWWTTWLDLRWESLFRDAVFSFGDGTLVQQPGWGIMKSGCFMTIIINSLARLLLHNVVIKRLGLDRDVSKVVMGDDLTLSDFAEYSRYELATNQLGFGLKPSQVEEHVSFAGWKMFGDYTALPEYEAKHVFRVTHAPDSVLAETLESYTRMYAFHQEWYDWLVTELMRVDPTRVHPRWILIRSFRGLSSVCR